MTRPERVRTGDDCLVDFASRWPFWLFAACVFSNPVSGLCWGPGSGSGAGSVSGTGTGGLLTRCCLLRL